jgi:hypothetical protein
MFRHLPRAVAALCLAAGAVCARAAERQALTSQSGLLVARSANLLAVGTRDAGASLILPAQTTLDAVAGDARAWFATGTRLLLNGKGSEIVIAAGGTSEATLLKPPAGRVARERELPQALVEHGALRGLVWLEGNDRGHYAVRAAAFDGALFGPAETISLPEHGSQMAPAVAVLADGAWLAVWSRYNGHDDDIVWSVRRGDVWSAPRRVHAANSVPDITPALIASERGALVAWNQYDGSDYRVAVARFDGSGFAELGTLGGPGWTQPRLASRGDGTAGALLLCRQADPLRWVVTELDGAARPQRFASTAGPPLGAPLLRAGTADGVTLTWPASALDQTLSWRAVP